jgi:hypothetical protein
MNRAWVVALATVLAILPTAGCKTKPPRSPRILGSVRPTVPMQAPPINARVPIDVPSAPVATPGPAVAATPAYAFPAQAVPTQPVLPAQPMVPVQPGPRPGPGGQTPVPDFGDPPSQDYGASSSRSSVPHLTPPPETDEMR